MKDFIRGSVKRIIDENSIEIEVTQIGRKNKYDYRGMEEVRVTDVKPFLISNKNGYCPKLVYEKILLGKDVTCLVDSRNSRGQIEGEVFLL
jgi:hypothetical protein